MKRQRPAITVTLVLAVLFLTIPMGFNMGRAQAATFIVTKTLDTNDGTCDADCSLREAVLAANALPGEDMIRVPAGTYTLTIVGPDGDGDLDLEDDVEIRGADMPSTVFDAGVFDILPGITAKISDMTISHGADPWFGTGIVNAGNLTLVACAISANGLGFYNSGSLTTRRSTITESGFVGVFNDMGGTVVLVDSVISRNGGIGIFNFGTATVTDCDVSANILWGPDFAWGAGIYNIGTLTLTGSTVSQNEAQGAKLSMGGGIYNEGTMDATNSTVSGNVAEYGSEIYNGGTLSLTNVTVSGSIYGIAITFTNTLINGGCWSLGVDVSNGGNLESPGDSCGLTSSTDQVNVPDPMLGPLADNGGRTKTHALLPDSPAIDRALNGITTRDQRGLHRPFDGDRDGVKTCDVGAIEYYPRDGY